MSPRATSDEHYIITLCDQVLNLRALRQHRFPFLRGDAASSKQGAPLPVDAYYPDLNLVIEYRERHHTESVPIMDRRMTVSGMCRRCQRKLYDQRRRDLLPAHGLRLVEFSYDQFAHKPNGRLLRNPEQDIAVVREALIRISISAS